MTKRAIILIFLFLGWQGTGGFCTRSLAAEEWQEYQTRHFLIYYKDAPEDFVKGIEETAERYYEEISKGLGFVRSEQWLYGSRAKIYIYRDREDYQKSAKQGEWSDGVAYFQQKIIRTFPAAHGFFDTTLPHELGHIIFREFVGFKVPLPLWLDEGVAMFQEKAKRWGAHKAVRKAIEEKKFLSLDELTQFRIHRNTPSEKIELFYAEAASVVYYMIHELGEFRFAAFCRGLKSQYGFEEAFRQSYHRFQTMKDLNDAWVDYLKQL